MSRIRTVKPELFRHEGLFEAEIANKLPLRLAFIGLLTCCDREGRFKWRPQRLKLDMLPYDNINIVQVLDVLAKHGFIKKYEHQGEWYGCIPSWSRHQLINHRELPSDIPEPTELTLLTTKTSELTIETTNDLSVTDACSTDESRMTDACSTDEPRVTDACSTDEPRVPDACSTHQPSVAEPSQLCPGTPGGNMEYGKEYGREGKGNMNVVASVTRRQCVNDPAQEIFKHWKTVMKHPDAKLDSRRKRLIGNALSFGYNIEQLCNAITGCSVTPHNMGDNDQGQRYDGLHIILRDADQIDRFIYHYHSPPQPIRDADKRTQGNIHAVQRWVDKKMQEELDNAKS